MFFSKRNVLALTASAAVLGGFSVSANAAQNTDNNQPTGVIGSTKNDKSNSGDVYDANGNTTGQKTIQGKSDAHVRITQGYLTLNLVPSFGFGTVNGQSGQSASGSSDSSKGGQTLKTIADNKAILNDDSLHGKNESKTLSVTDSRKTAEDGGYTVSAQMDNFRLEQNGERTGDKVSQDGNPFVLNLSEGQLQRDDNSDGDNGNKTVTGKTSFSLTEGATSATNDVLKSTKQGTGNSSITFNGGSLFVPDNVNAGNYAASITWTLSPNTDSLGNVSGS